MGLFDGFRSAGEAAATQAAIAEAIDRRAREMGKADHHPRPLNSLVASAKRLTRKSIQYPAGRKSGDGWQDEAAEMARDLVGELSFVSNVLSRRAGQAHLYVGKVNDNDDLAAEPEPVEKGDPADVLDLFEKNPAARGQIIARLFANLFIAGDGWVVGVPKTLLSEGKANPEDRIGPGASDGIDLDDLVWRMLSLKEVDVTREGTVKIAFDSPTPQEFSPDDIFLIRVWQPDDFEWWLADSPVRAVLPVLRELVGLTMHISAQVDSRLAGAGLFIVPESAKQAINARLIGPDPDDDEDPFTEAIMEAMLTPVGDRSSAAALVPLILSVPDDVADKFRHIRFGTDLDATAKDLRDEAIRRLALGLDAPPEVLLGTGGMNHWGAWLVSETVVTTHIEPSLALICDALTTQFLWPVLIEQGMSETEAHEYVVWYNVQHLIERPNKAGDALNLFHAGAITAGALRRESGFGDGDAPKNDVAVQTALAMISAAPSLASNPGIAELVRQIREVLPSGDAAIDDDIAEAIPATGVPGTIDAPANPS